MELDARKDAVATRANDAVAGAITFAMLMAVGVGIGCTANKMFGPDPITDVMGYCRMVGTAAIGAFAFVAIAFPAKAMSVPAARFVRIHIPALYWLLSRLGRPLVFAATLGHDETGYKQVNTR